MTPFSSSDFQLTSLLKLPQTENVRLRWRNVDDMLDDIFRDMRSYWVRDFVAEDSPLEDVRLMTLPYIQEQAKPHNLLYQLADAVPGMLVQGAPMRVMERGDLTVGLNMISVHGIGEVEIYTHTPLSVRRYVFHKRRRTGFLLAHEGDKVEVCWFARGAHAVFVHSVFKKAKFLAAMRLREARTGCQGIDMEVLAKSLQSFTIHVAAAMPGISDLDLKGPDACIPLYSGGYIMSTIGSTVLRDTLFGNIQAYPGLPTSAVQSLRTHAVRKRMAFICANPNNELSINFDFTGVCSASDNQAADVQRDNSSDSGDEEPQIVPQNWH